MKTLIECQEWVAIESNYENWDACLEEIKEDKDLICFYCRLVAEEFANQQKITVLDELIDSVFGKGFWSFFASKNWQEALYEIRNKLEDS